MSVTNQVFNGGRLVLRVDGVPGGTRDPVIKPNFTDGVGWWAGMMVRLPPSMPFNVVYSMLVRQVNISGDSGFTGAGDSNVAWCGNIGTPIRTPQVRHGTGIGGTLIPANPEADARLSTLTSPPDAGADYMLVWGLTNRGTPAAQDWVWFLAMCPIGGTAPTGYCRTWSLGPTFPGIGNTIAWFDEMFVTGASSARRTPAGFGFEHLFVIRGEAPWDTTNNRFDQAAIESLANGTANCEGAAILNGGQLLHWWTLRSMSLPNRTCRVTGRIWASESYDGTNFIVDGTVIGQGEWLDAETVTIGDAWRTKEVWGGRGTLTVPYSGTYTGGTGVERRWVEAVSKAPLQGPLGQWTQVQNWGSGQWSETRDVLPWSGPNCTEYELQVRQIGASGTAEKRGLWIGTHVLNNGQSGAELIFNTPNNFLNITAPAGCVGEMLDLDNQSAGTQSSYIQPTPRIWFVEGAVTPPNVHHGFLLFLREWQKRGQGPVQVINLAYAGTGPSQFYNADPAPGPGGWTLRGQVYGLAPPTGPLDATGVGFSSMLAFLARRTADLATLMWTPGLGVSQTPDLGNNYEAMIDEIFNNGPPVPWIVFPIWRNGREPQDMGGSIAHRNTHIVWALDNPARRYLAPYLPDIAMETTGNGHPAGGANNNGPDHPTIKTVSDSNIVGSGRLGATIGALCAEWFHQSSSNPRKLWGPRVLKAHFVDGTRTAIDVEVGRRVGTLNGAAPLAEVWFVSTDNGTTWTRLSAADTTVTIVGTKVRLTRTSGSWPANNVRVSLYRENPWHQLFNSDAGQTAPPLGEWAFERYADGLLYDMDRGDRGGMAGAEAGWPLSILQLDGVPVTARDNVRRVLAVQRLPAGNYSLQARVYGPSHPPDGTLVTVTNQAQVT